jgi:flavin reductase (DIM6/NTAB) family NADH-FMN oxidoreductase RutF
VSSESIPPAIPPVLGRIPSGIFILTARAPDGAETGMLASWVMQAGFEPPMITTVVKQGRYVADWLTAGAPFNLNLVAEGQTQMLSHFGKGFEPGEPAFTGLDLDRCPREVAILKTALGHLECTPVGHVDSGDHRVFLAKVEGGRLAAEDRPMVHIRKNGLRY